MSYTAKLKKRAPLWVWAILLTVVITAVVIIVLHLTGYYDFSFLGMYYLGFHVWEADVENESVINALLGDAGIAALGAVIFYFFSHYVFGYKANIPLQPQQSAIQTGLTVQPAIQQTKPITVEEVGTA
jgi:hypothetical protein